MNFVESVRIEGFWGDRTVEVKFNRDFNFLIGLNGSGKTTIINLIAASLRADVAALYATSFTRIYIVMKSQGANRKPVIEITKSINELLGSIEISYLVKDKTTDKGSTFVIEGPNDDRLYRDPRTPRTRRVVEAGAKLSAVLESIIEVNWLSVHRSAPDRSPRHMRDEEFDSTIDQKIFEISRKFSTYFSLLASKASEESKQFQEQVFLSLLEREQNTLLGIISEQDDPEERNSVIGVLRDLGVPIAKATKSVNSHYTKFESAKKLYRDEQKLTFDTAATLSDTRRMRQLVSRWKAFNITRDEIYGPRTNFETILNGLFSGKELHFDQRNIPTIHLTRGDQSRIDSLSSGEKQLFILLGEALLQEGRPVVFISDEPELSLHVAWQSVLFENVRRLNPACQIICATHSPDIVGPFQDRVIQVEDCFVNV